MAVSRWPLAQTTHFPNKLCQPKAKIRFQSLSNSYIHFDPESAGMEKGD